MKWLVRSLPIVLVSIGFLFSFPTILPTEAARNTERRIAHAEKRYEKRQLKYERKIQRLQYKYAKQHVKRTVRAESYCLHNRLSENQCIDAWITRNNLNTYGDPKDTVYAGGTPLFDEKTGKYINRYHYIKMRHPDMPWWYMR